MLNLEELDCIFLQCSLRWLSEKIHNQLYEVEIKYIWFFSHHKSSTKNKNSPTNYPCWRRMALQKSLALPTQNGILWDYALENANFVTKRNSQIMSHSFCLPIKVATNKSNLVLHVPIKHKQHCSRSLKWRKIRA